MYAMLLSAATTGRVIGLIAATGLRVSEALDLPTTCSPTLSCRNTKFARASACAVTH